MAQYLCDLMVWELVLNKNPQVTGIVELGTFQGGFSWFLDAQARARGIEFRTYDILIPEVEPPGFRQLDIYRYSDQVDLGGRYPIALFCDGGNKPRELALFPAALRPRLRVPRPRLGRRNAARARPRLYGGAVRRLLRFDRLGDAGVQDEAVSEHDCNPESVSMMGQREHDWRLWKREPRYEPDPESAAWPLKGHMEMWYCTRCRKIEERMAPHEASPGSVSA